MGFQDYLTSLGENPYFGAGAGLFGVGVVTQAARKGSVILSSILKRKYVLTMEVPRFVAGLLNYVFLFNFHKIVTTVSMYPALLQTLQKIPDI